MSLISDGLKKAHLDALRQDREQRRQFLSPGRVDVPQRTSHGAAIAAAAAGSAVIAAIVAIYFVRTVSPPEVAAARPTPQPVAAAAVAAPLKTTAPQPVTVAAPALPLPAAGAVTAVQGTTSTLVPLAETPKVKAPAAVERPRREAPAQARAAEPVRAEAATPPVQAPPREKTLKRDRFVNGETYASPISAPGGIEITLSGISSARGESVAIMNGNVVRVGSAIGPFVVETIERGRVQLRYIDVRIWMTY